MKMPSEAQEMDSKEHAVICIFLCSHYVPEAATLIYHVPEIDFTEYESLGREMHIFAGTFDKLVPPVPHAQFWKQSKKIL